ncbi:opioid-binding protein/cell adhesion molecule-like isoform X1 [Macrobrachium rosenbergii]|uniref:opioid-binding protein/cell adhesion molecule-like isoform X1 n=1 Tax=Macrobrachium rosenbergii TaxID=79674 RepID=UPI0034D4F623
MNLLLILLVSLTSFVSTHTHVIAPGIMDSAELRYGGVESGQFGAGGPPDGGSASLSSLWSYSTVTEDRYDHALHGDQHELTPYFQDFENSTNITAQLGSTAYLNCRVNRLHEKTVSWVRRDGDKIKLITWGLHTYSNDARYSLNFEHPNNWKLQIKYTQRRDQGTYECQISTHPPKILYVRLNIVAPVVEIIDERGASVQEKFYKTGSTIELKCTISQMPQAQTFILWRHGEHMLNYDTSRGGISVKTDMSSSVIVSTLFIANATPRDSGNYTCSLGDVATGGVLVHILNGEHPAAMQHGSGTNDLCSLAYVLGLAVATTLLNTLGITQMR